MSTYTKALTAAAVFALALGQASAEGDPMLATSVGLATQRSIGNHAHLNRCMKIVEASGTASYEGNCFGFPSEVMSGFDFDRWGRLIRSRIMFADADYALSRIRVLTASRGTPREVIRASNLTDRILEWRIGNERWQFIERTGTGQWEFMRELIEPDNLPEPDELPSIFPEPVPCCVPYEAHFDRYY